MKCAWKILICLAGGLVLNTSLHADSIVLPGNPYAPVVVRNIFGLNPPPLVDPNPPTAEPPVQITPNGIMSIFGELQVLFKVAGEPPGQDAYTLSEGERQDDIEVVKIDEKAGIVTFNNHGVVQALPLVAATPSSTPASSPLSGSVIPNPAAGGPNGFMNRFGNRGGNFPGRNRGGGNGNDGNSSGADSGSNPGNGSTQNNSFIQQPQTGLNEEEQVVAIEVNRELTKQQVIEGNMPPPPPTEGTPPDATGVGGGPLVTPPPGSSP